MNMNLIKRDLKKAANFLKSDGSLKCAAMIHEMLAMDIQLVEKDPTDWNQKLDELVQEAGFIYSSQMTGYFEKYRIDK